VCTVTKGDNNLRLISILRFCNFYAAKLVREKFFLCAFAVQFLVNSAILLGGLCAHFLVFDPV
jgi:hypothetical protein